MMQIVRIYFGYWLLVIFMNHAYISHVICICIRIAAAAEEVVYLVVAEPQEPQEQAPQQEVREESAQGPANPWLSGRHKASPGAQSINLNYDTYICIYYLCIIFRNCLKP